MIGHRKYHFTGIGGVGMAGVAFLLKKSGCDVSGCDLHSTPRTRWLEANGIHVDLGHSPEHVTPDTDVCVFTPAVQKTNPEFIAAQSLAERDAGAPTGAPARHEVKYRGEVLAELFNASDGIAVCGTHGKTTTATFIAKLLRALGDDPSWCIGGETGDFPVAGVGSGKFVVEADESDGTLALYRASMLVVTSLEYDHPDHFRTYADYLDCYRKAMSAAKCVIESARLDVGDWPELRGLVLGEHNVRNARTAIEVALRLGHAREEIASALPQALSSLPDRRFERIWPPGLSPKCASPDAPISIFTDYAHHPTEISCAISMAKALNPKRLRVMFQPHRYSRTKALLDGFPSALSGADEVVLVPVYPAFEEPIIGGDIADLYLAFRNAGRHSARGLILSRNAEEAWRHMFLSAKEGDLIMVLGAGDLIDLVPQIVNDMRSLGDGKPQGGGRGKVDLSRLSLFRTGGISYGNLIQGPVAPGGGKHGSMIVGGGSNIWFSDCTTDCDIVKAPAECGAARPGASLLANHPELAFMAGIPGTVGGWAKMNAGAFGDSFGNHIEYVIADGRKILAKDCGFGYRKSSIPGLITEVALKKTCANGGEGQNEAQSLDAAHYITRRHRFPPRTCGSVFRNPSPQQPAGKLLEEAGAKSLKVGGAYVWGGHANVIVAGDGCTSSDILALARLMAARVRDRFGITLVPEIAGLQAT